MHTLVVYSKATETQQLPIVVRNVLQNGLKKGSEDACW
jgi:hypothetical protein